MKRHFSLDLRYVFNFVCDFSALLTFPDAQAISKLTVIPYVAVIPLLPTRGWHYIFCKTALEILQKYFVNIWRSLYEYSSRRGSVRLFTSVHGRRHARWGFIITFLRLSIYGGLSVRDPSARTSEEGRFAYLYFTASFGRFTGPSMPAPNLYLRSVCQSVDERLVSLSFLVQRLRPNNLVQSGRKHV